jgi:hypothetical protein
VTIPAPPPSGAAAFALSGKISGPAASQVVAVVLFGPNHVLHEATRVAPGPDGSWSVETLAPGRYRVVLDGGGHKVLVVEPSFLTIDVEPGSPVVAPELRVLRAL